MRGRGSWWRIGLVASVLAAVAVRFLTPVGWMPNPDGGKGPLFVICTGQGPRLASGLDLPTHGPDHNTPHEHCLFAGFSMVGGPAVARVPAPPERFVLEPGARVAPRVLWRPRQDHSPHAARAPPLTI